ncbi:hypothetical protein Rleg10DRAFT_5361 [Rhizobium leguminosarum bv. trifolii WSM2012]|nr:hypothetical protein Rleg10DRAFT_5361 [Rhizobium leguminosarum bv. trifolii WSM2012]
MSAIGRGQDLRFSPMKGGERYVFPLMAKYY